MMSNEDPLAPVGELITEYITLVRAELTGRWTKWATTLTDLEKYEVAGGLLARQVTLATQLAATPSIWNAHVAPLFLRAMVDTYITLVWILQDLVPRARQFILFGLGQNKLYLEHLKKWGEEHEVDLNEVVKSLEEWQNQQRFTFLTEVSLGSWAELPTRKMAEECGELEFYNLAYLPFSAAVHSMWHHVGRLNVAPCDSPLHRYHRIPVDPDLDPDPDYLYRAAKYVEKTFRRFDQSVSIQSDVPSAFAALVSRLEKLGRLDREARGERGGLDASSEEELEQP